VGRSGLIAKARSLPGNRKVIEFGGIEPNPHDETVVKAVEISQQILEKAF